MLPKDKRAELIEEWERRITMKGLARKYGLSKAAVAMILYRHRHNKKS